jgi:hypothetical protein
MAMKIFLTILFLTPAAVPGLFLTEDKTWKKVLSRVCVGYMAFVVLMIVVVLIGSVWFFEE